MVWIACVVVSVFALIAPSCSKPVEPRTDSCESPAKRLPAMLQTKSHQLPDTKVSGAPLLDIDPPAMLDQMLKGLHDVEVAEKVLDEEDPAQVLEEEFAKYGPPTKQLGASGSEGELDPPAMLEQMLKGLNDVEAAEEVLHADDEDEPLFPPHAKGAHTGTTFSPGSTKHKPCEWTVHYDLWTSPLENTMYEAVDEHSSMPCLEACCRDPTCQGIALTNVHDAHCFRYRSKPAIPEDKPGRRLGDGKWLSAMKPTWSVVVKTESEAPATSAALQRPASAQHASTTPSLVLSPGWVGWVREAHSGPVGYSSAILGMETLALLGALLLGYCLASSSIAKRTITHSSAHAPVLLPVQIEDH